MFRHNCGKGCNREQIFCVSCGIRQRSNDELSTERDLITNYFNRGMKYATMVFILQKIHNISISLRTLKRRLQEFGLNKSATNHDQARRRIPSELMGPSSQMCYCGMWNKLCTTYGVNIPRDVVMKILQELDPDGCKQRKRRKLNRRIYTSHGPNTT